MIKYKVVNNQASYLADGLKHAKNTEINPPAMQGV